MASLAPISVASIVIGFISFSLTLAIWLNSFWEAFVTVAHAGNQIQDSLSILRQNLYEELEYLRRIRRQKQELFPSRKQRRRRSGRRDKGGTTAGHNEDDGAAEEEFLYEDSGPVRVQMDTVRDLIAGFKFYEAPFLVIPGKTDRRRTEKDLEWSFDATKRAYQCDLFRRVLWLRSKGGVMSIADKLQRIQVHRSAIESTETRLMLAETMGMVRDCERRLEIMGDAVRRMDEEMFLRGYRESRTPR